MKVSKADMKAFEDFVDERLCPHQVPITRHCKSCEREMMLDFISHNLEDIGPDEVADAIRERCFTLKELQVAVERRIA
jgi:protein tyrosine phosphatase (PTP) superfamily phosphohydrolase (DUF442 family)